MSDSEVTNHDSMSSRAKKTAKFVRETEAPSPMVIELDDESDTIASRVKDMVRLRKKRRKKETPSVMVIESDDDSDSIASRVKKYGEVTEEAAEKRSTSRDGDVRFYNKKKKSSG